MDTLIGTELLHRIRENDDIKFARAERAKLLQNTSLSILEIAGAGLRPAVLDAIGLAFGQLGLPCHNRFPPASLLPR